MVVPQYDGPYCHRQASFMLMPPAYVARAASRAGADGPSLASATSGAETGAAVPRAGAEAARSATRPAMAVVPKNGELTMMATVDGVGLAMIVLVVECGWEESVTVDGV